MAEFRPAEVSRPVARPHFLPYALAALAVTLIVIVSGAVHQAFAILFGVLCGLLGCLVEVMRVQRKMAKIEVQLSDAIDIIVGALQAGAGVMESLTNAGTEAREPLRKELVELVNRLRLGDEPDAVFRDFSRRIPLESFALFAATLTTHWEVGGSLAPPMASVGRTVRDRIEVSRRIRSLLTQSRVSTIAVLGATYFIAAIIWRNDPERMGEFLATSIGRSLVIAAIAMQALGLIWSTWLGRVRF
jgi:Flp pilus assembly protein TadB